MALNLLDGLTDYKALLHTYQDAVAATQDLDLHEDYYYIKGLIDGLVLSGATGPAALLTGVASQARDILSQLADI